MTIRRATANDALEIQRVTFDSVPPGERHDFNAAGWKRFQAVNSLAAIRRRLGDSNHLTLCWIQDAAIMGFITIHDKRQLSELFVLPQARNMGVARSLWEHARTECLQLGNRGNFWVKSSTFAVEVYESFGFVRCGSKTASNGISYIPMTCVEREPNGD